MRSLVVLIFVIIGLVSAVSIPSPEQYRVTDLDKYGASGIAFLPLHPL
jgi:hypothetical protein